MLGAFTLEASRTVVAKADVAQPRISDAAARQAQTVVEKMISGPVTVTYRSKTWTISTAELAKMIKFQSVESTGSSARRTDGSWSRSSARKKPRKTIVPKVGAALGNPPQDARFVTHNGSVTIAPSKDGVGPDVEEFAASLATVLKNPGRARTVELRTKITPPRLTTAAAREMGIHERISTFTTTY